MTHSLEIRFLRRCQLDRTRCRSAQNVLGAGISPRKLLRLAIVLTMSFCAGSGSAAFAESQMLSADSGTEDRFGGSGL